MRVIENKGDSDCRAKAGLLYILVALAIQSIQKTIVREIGENNKLVVIIGAHTLQQVGSIGSTGILFSLRHVTQCSIRVSVGIELKNIN